MPRPSRLAEQREELLPLLARVFTRLGYRRATTASLARGCRVQENILYRHWPDKKAMFLAAIEYVYDFSERTWRRLLGESRDRGRHALQLLEFEAKHHGEFGHYRIIFTGLGESDDREIRQALRRLFKRFHAFLVTQILAHRDVRSGAQPRRGRGTRRAVRPGEAALSAELSSWAVIGLATIANMGRELGVLTSRQRVRLIGDAGRLLLEGAN